jgi:formylglycine-generating enzyme required for sulfatase activity
MKKWLWIAVVIIFLWIAYATYARWREKVEQEENIHYEKEQTLLVVVSEDESLSFTLYKAGETLEMAQAITITDSFPIWLSAGNYFLQVKHGENILYYPASILGYRSGPDRDGALAITLRRMPTEYPPRLLRELPECVYIPAGSFVIGDKHNPREPHYVWLPAYFIAPFEVTNAEFRAFQVAKDGYVDDANWSEEGRKWRSRNPSRALSTIKEGDTLWKRFGQPDQPVTEVTWYEAAAFCQWLTRKIGDRKWIYSLPTEAEWEKAARGPDHLDYGLSNVVSDREGSLYNWKKNPDAPITVVGIGVSQSKYRPNRYGLYHTSGNVAEWTLSIHQPYSRDNPYQDHDARNRLNSTEMRVVRGGSWYSASTALLLLSYRDAFLPDVCSNEKGFRIVARRLPNT